MGPAAPIFHGAKKNTARLSATGTGPFLATFPGIAMRTFAPILFLVLLNVSPPEARGSFLGNCAVPFVFLANKISRRQPRERIVPAMPPTAEEAAEGLARIESIEKSLGPAIDELRTPWRWLVKLRRNELLRQSFIALDTELKNQKRSLVEASPREREELAQTAVDSVVGGYRTLPSTLVLTVGMGVPIGLAYSVLLLPEAVRPAGYGIANLFSGPFAFGLTYWLNGKLKPISGIKPRNTSGTKGPFIQHMERIGSSSTGLSDPFKDGRNIKKDAVLELRDSLNDAAWNITDEHDAREAVAMATLQAAAGFPEVKIDTLTSYLMYLKVKQRFSNPAAHGQIKTLIREFARKESLPDETTEGALNLLDRLVRPDLWK